MCPESAFLALWSGEKLISVRGTHIVAHLFLHACHVRQGATEADIDCNVLLIPQFCPQRLERLLGTVQFLEPVYHWSRSAENHISEVSHWLQCIQFRAESRSRFFLRSFSCREEAGNCEILRLSWRTLENRRKLQRTERIDLRLQAVSVRPQFLATGL